MSTAPTQSLTLCLEPQQIAAMDAVISECGLSQLNGHEQFDQTFRLAAGVRQLRELITTEAMQDIMQLQNTALGFRTDKPQGYDVGTVKDCVIDATLRGLRCVANEFNIISSRTYITKEGFARLVRGYPGMSDLKLSFNVPHMRDGGAIVAASAKWIMNGAPDSLEREIPIRVNKGMGSDAILGKATRKMLASVYERLTGSEYGLPEGEVGDVIDGSVASKSSRSDLTDQLPSNPLDGLDESLAEATSLTVCDDIDKHYRDKGLTPEQDEQLQAVVGMRKEEILNTRGEGSNPKPKEQQELV